MRMDDNGVTFGCHYCKNEDAPCAYLGEWTDEGGTKTTVPICTICAEEVSQTLTDVLAEFSHGAKVYAEYDLAGARKLGNVLVKLRLMRILEDLIRPPSQDE